MAKIGFIYISFFLAISIILFIVGGLLCDVLSILLFLITLFCFYFFRDPSRNVIINENNILSPADGTVFEISEVEEPLFIKEKVKIIKIFLSVLNVHIQRAPVSGDVKYISEQKGSFLPANHVDASTKNTQNLIGFEGKSKILVKQIAGIIARKCDLWAKLNQKFNQGEKIGIIHFGSQVDIYVPNNTKINVTIGQKVKGGITILGEIGE